MAAVVPGTPDWNYQIMKKQSIWWSWLSKERGGQGHGGELISWSRSQMNSCVCPLALATEKTNNKEANGMVKRADKRGG